jgi:hypothetical protein
MLDQRDLKQLETIIRVTLAEQDRDGGHTCTQTDVINRLDKNLDLLTQQHAQILEMVKKHELTLYGDGKEGGLTTTMKGVQDFVKSNQALGNKVIEWLLLLFLGGVIVLFVERGGVPVP